MRLATGTRKWIYPAILAMLPLVFVGAQGQAWAQANQAQAQANAAQFVGADTEKTPTWSQVNTPGSGYDLHSPRSIKFFYNNEPLPSNDSAKTNPYGIDGCGKMSNGSYVYGLNVLCIIVWNTASSPDGSDLHNFLESTLTDPHQILMAFCNEPESEVKNSKCICDTGTVIITPCQNGADFISQFETESTYITNFESNNKIGTPNVRVAEDSEVDYYNQNSGTCGMKGNPDNYIVPAQYVSSYLVDVYEPNKTTLPPESLGQSNAWNNWVSCTANNPGVSRGIAEFGIDCGLTSGVRTASLFDTVVAGTYQVDADYLLNNFPNLKVWNLWDGDNCAIDSIKNDPNYAPNAVATWQAIEDGTIN